MKSIICSIKIVFNLMLICSLPLVNGCQNSPENKEEKPIQANLSKSSAELSAKDILGNPNYLAMSYGGYRTNSRDVQPTVKELKEDMLLLHAMGIRIIRTYQTELEHPRNVLKAIRELKNENPSFEMYMMVGAWINCENAWTGGPNHNEEDFLANSGEVGRAVEMAKAYPDIVKVIAVGNEAMVRWAQSYFVQPNVILKWVNVLQGLKERGDLPKDLWITSSDNFASWGGDDASYHTDDLKALIKAVDFISLHTYPMHDTHYNGAFWGVSESDKNLSKEKLIEVAMKRALVHAQTQYQSTKDFVRSLGVNVPIHIGETGWASASNGFYSPDGTKACDEYKEGVYYRLMREWTNKENISCFYFEGFDEIWKDAQNSGGSENHFGLFTIDGQAKYAIWDLVDVGTFKGLSRGGQSIVKTYNGDYDALIESTAMPPKLNN